jgi:hypothetical protein
MIHQMQIYRTKIDQIKIYQKGTTAIRRTPVRQMTVRRTPVRRIGGNGHFVEPQFVEVLQHRTPVCRTPVCRLKLKLRRTFNSLKNDQLAGPN